MLQDVGVVLHYALHQDLHKLKQRPVLDFLMHLDETSGDQGSNRSSRLRQTRGGCLIFGIARRHEDQYALESLMERGNGGLQLRLDTAGSGQQDTGRLWELILTGSRPTMAFSTVDSHCSNKMSPCVVRNLAYRTVWISMPASHHEKTTYFIESEILNGRSL